MVNVFVTRKIPEEGLRLLKEANYNIKIYEDKIISKNELIENIKWADALFCMVTDKIDDEIISNGKNLRVIANYAAGYDNINLKTASEKKIPVTNTPDVVTNATAEHTMALILALSRLIPEADKFVRNGEFKEWSPNIFLGQELRGKTLGIIGLGKIGKTVAKIAKYGFGMKVFYYSRTRDKDYEEKDFNFSELNTLLKEADFISLHVPLNQSTEYLINENNLRIIKDNAYLINTSRGKVIDEKSLVKALKENKLAGAALDVYENEPNLISGLKELKNVILTPHIGTATIKTRVEMGEAVSRNIIAVLSGKIPPNIVNKEIY
ncbi:MAG: D-glycerate dehydrogenase [Nanoarchaeota archaeon]